MKRILTFIRAHYVFILFFLSFSATVGSLFISEIVKLPPCDLCWYQRGMMYPIAVVTLVAALVKDTKVYRYVIPLAAIGWILALYQYILQKTDWFDKVSFCSVANPCSEIQFEWFGFVTIPFMSLATFTLLLLICFVYWKSGARATKKG